MKRDAVIDRRIGRHDRMLGAHRIAALSRYLDTAVLLLNTGHRGVGEQLSAARRNAACKTQKVFRGVEGRLIGIAQTTRVLVPAQGDSRSIMDGHSGFLRSPVLFLHFSLACLRTGKQETINTTEVALDALG